MKHGDDVFGTAMNAMRDAITNHGMIDENGDVVIKTSTYRYMVACNCGYYFIIY